MFVIGVDFYCGVNVFFFFTGMGVGKRDYQ